MYGQTAVVTLLALLVIWPSAGGQGVEKIGGPVENAGRVSGRVVVDGQPGAGITVQVYTTFTDVYARGSSAGTSVTDENGRYDLEGLGQGLYLVEVRDPGLIRRIDLHTARSRTPDPVIRVSKAEKVDGIDFDLVRGGIITGRVTGPDGEPVSGRSIFITGGGPGPGSYPVSLPAIIETGENGDYIAQGLPPGNYQVGVNASRSGKLYPRTYYPNTPNRLASPGVDVNCGVVTPGIDIKLGPPGRPGRISGRMIDEQTKLPVVDEHYLLKYEGDYSQPIPGPPTDAKGNFELEEVPPGHYGLLAVPNTDTGAQYYGEWVPFDLSGEDVTGLEIKLHRSFTVTGRLVFSQINHPRAPVRFSDIHLNVTVSGKNSHAGTYCPSRVEADGRFTITGVMPGRLYIGVDPRFGPKGLQLVHLDSEGGEANAERNWIEVSVNDQGLPVIGSNPISGLRLSVGYGDVALAGRAMPKGALPSEGIRVRVEASPLSRDGTSGTAWADWEGKFVVEGLTNGDYELVFSYGGGSFSFPTTKQRVTLTRGKALPVQVVLVPFHN